MSGIEQMLCFTFQQLVIEVIALYIIHLTKNARRTQLKLESLSFIQDDWIMFMLIVASAIATVLAILITKKRKFLAILFFADTPFIIYSTVIYSWSIITTYHRIKIVHEEMYTKPNKCVGRRTRLPRAAGLRPPTAANCKEMLDSHQNKPAKTRIGSRNSRFPIDEIDNSTLVQYENESKHIDSTKSPRSTNTHTSPENDSKGDSNTGKSSRESHVIQKESPGKAAATKAFYIRCRLLCLAFTGVGLGTLTTFLFIFFGIHTVRLETDYREEITPSQQNTHWSSPLVNTLSLFCLIGFHYYGWFSIRLPWRCEHGRPHFTLRQILSLPNQKDGRNGY